MVQKSTAPYLVVRDHNHTIGERAFHPSVGGKAELTGYRRIAADSYHGRCPPMCQSCDQQAEGFLGDGHVGIVEIAVNEVEPCPEKLGDMDTIKIGYNSQYLHIFRLLFRPRLSSCCDTTLRGTAKVCLTPKKR